MFTSLAFATKFMLSVVADRMPVIFGDKESSEAWLNGSFSKVDTLLKPYENPDLV